jgi:predicted Zn-dependent peptidase
MLFKGTRKRPTTLDISSELDAIGGEFNAFTSKDKTGYFAKADAKHLKTALDVIADIYLNSKIEEKEIQKESGTILQELNMYEDMPINSIADIFENLLYKGNPLGREIIGYKKTISSLKRKDLVGYMKKFYVASDMVVAIAGKFDEKKAISRVKGYFSGMEKKKKPKFIELSERQNVPQVRVKFKKTDQTNFILGVRAYDLNHKDRFALSLLSIILGGNMSSRLFTEIREKRGLAYYIKTSADSYKDAGYLATQAGVEHKNLGLAIKTILDEYRKIKMEKVSESELKKAKDFIKGKAVMGMEASDEVAMFLINQEISRNKIMTIPEIFSLFDKVTTNDILRVAKDVFDNRKLNLAVIGPRKDEGKLKKLLNI